VEKPSAEQLEKFWELVRQGVVTNSNFQRFLSDPDRYPKGEVLGTYKVTVDYSVSLNAMVHAGAYDWVYRDIDSGNKQPTQRSNHRVDIEVSLVHLDGYSGIPDIINKLKKLGLRPATYEELLTLGAFYPNLQRKYPIAALGSGYDDGSGRKFRSKPVIGESTAGLRSLDLIYNHQRSGRCIHFAAVQEDI
jgi:hypothetical protein